MKVTSRRGRRGGLQCSRVATICLRMRGWGSPDSVLPLTTWPFRHFQSQMSMVEAAVLMGAAVAFAPPKLVPIGVVEMVWDQDVDACPGKNVVGEGHDTPAAAPFL